MFLGVAAGVAGVEKASRAGAPSHTAGPPPLKLAVIVSVDGLSWARLESYRPWFVAGLKRLLDEGLVETACRYRHLTTETGPGHSSLATGAPPRITGIVANRWFERGKGGGLRTVNSVDNVLPNGESLLGPGNLRVPTLADRLVLSRPGSRTVSVSAKDRSAIFMAGRDRRHAVYWFDRKRGEFATSAAYEPPPAARSVVTAYNSSRGGAAIRDRFGARWPRLPLLAVPPTAPGAQPVPGPALFDFQIPDNGLGFDHDLTLHPDDYLGSLYISPFIDDLVADLTLAFLHDERLALGRGDAPDLLTVGFSAQDVVSHSYGNESEENLDVLRRLDLHVGRLLEALEGLGPRGTVALALSADHGFLVIPEAEKKRNPAFQGGRLVDSERTMPSFTARLNRLVAEELCVDPATRPVFGVESWALAYNRPALPLRTLGGRCGPGGEPVTAASIDAVLPGVVGRFYKEELQEVLLVSQRDRWPADDPAVPFARNDFDAERSGDALLIPRPGVLMHWDPGRGSGHGSHYDYDTHVPLILWGAGFPAERSDTDASPYDVAPTLGHVLGVTLPDAVGRSLAPKR